MEEVTTKKKPLGRRLLAAFLTWCDRVGIHFVTSPAQAWDVGTFAANWSLCWRFLTVTHELSEPGDCGPARTYFLLGDRTGLFSEFLDAACK